MVERLPEEQGRRGFDSLSWHKGREVMNKEKIAIGYNAKAIVSYNCATISNIYAYCMDDHCCCGECFNSMAGEAEAELEISRSEVIELAKAMKITSTDLK